MKKVKYQMPRNPREIAHEIEELEEQRKYLQGKIREARIYCMKSYEAKIKEYEGEIKKIDELLTKIKAL